jgi:hypothetical protein
VIIRHLDTTDFDATYDAMRLFTAAREATTPDELWLTDHPPVYTAGAAGRPEHFPDTGLDGGVPVRRIDRGGQITYHGPGQPIVYTLLDLTRRRNPVHIGHPDIHENNVRLKIRNDGDGRPPRPRLTDYLETVVSRENGAQSLDDQMMVINQHDPNPAHRLLALRPQVWLGDARNPVRIYGRRLNHAYPPSSRITGEPAAFTSGSDAPAQFPILPPPALR